MNQATLYQKSNNVQRVDAKNILDEFASVFQWRLDGKDTLLDIGCGSGDVTMDFICPLLPNIKQKVVATDISPKMIRHARKTSNSSTNPVTRRVTFEVLDIAGEVPINFQGQFDHVTSFYCLHWIQNQKKALNNIFSMLKSDGDCLLVFLASNPVFDVYKRMSINPQWNPYMKDVDTFIAPLHCSPNPGAEFGQLLYESGFIDYSVEIREQIFIYEGTDILKNNLKAVNPFIERLPSHLQEKFLEDHLQLTIDMKLGEQILNTNDYRFISPYKLVVAYARK